MYRPDAATLVKCYKTEPSRGIFNMGQPTRGQGGTVRKVQVMSSDDEKRMAMRKEMLAAKRAQMPQQRIKLVYNSNNNSNMSNKGNVQQEKIAPVKVNALDYEEELRRRKQMKQNALKLLLEKAEKKALASKVVVKEVVKEIDKSGDASKQVWSSGKPKEVVTDEEELIEVVGKVVGAGEAQEFEFGEEAITVEDELLWQDLGEVLQESGSAMVEDCNVKETSCTAGETVVEKRDEHADQEYTLGCPFKVTCAELKFVHKYNLDVHMFKEHEVGEMPDDSLRPKEELVSQATEQEMTNEKEKEIGLEFKEPNSNIAERSLSPIIMSSRKRSSLSSPCSVSPKTTCGFNTPSPSLDRRSKALASVITSNQRKVCLCR